MVQLAMSEAALVVAQGGVQGIVCGVSVDNPSGKPSEPSTSARAAERACSIFN